MNRFVTLALLGVMLAGCAEDSSPLLSPDASEPMDPAPLRTLAPDLGCGHFCEPTLATDGGGRLWVHSQTQIRIWDNDTWSSMQRPPVPDGARPDVFQNDVLLQGAPWGSMFYSALLTRYEPDLQALVLDGMQVAWSDDGLSWAANQFVGLGERMAGDVTDGLGADRQWLAFHEDQVALAFHQVSPALVFDDRIPAEVDFVAGLAHEDAILVAMSADRGASFGPFTRTDDVSYSLHTHVGGPPQFDAGGRLHAPVHRYGPTDGGLYLMRSDDGATWEETMIDPTGGTMFPVLGSSPAGLVAAWHGQDGAIWSASSDDGVVWSEGAKLSAQGAARSSPWVSGGERPLIAWMEDVDGTTWLRAWYDDAVHDLLPISVPPGIRANTDFVHAVPYGAGHAILVADSGSALGGGGGQVHIVLVA